MSEAEARAELVRTLHALAWRKARQISYFESLRTRFDTIIQPCIPVLFEGDMAPLDWHLPTVPAVSYGFWYRDKEPGK